MKRSIALLGLCALVCVLALVSLPSVRATGVDVDLSSELDLDLETEMEDWLGLEADVQSENQPQLFPPTVLLETHADADVDTEAEATVEVAAEGEADAETEADADVDTEAETEVAAEAETETEAEAETEVDAEAETEVETESESERRHHHRHRRAAPPAPRRPPPPPAQRPGPPGRPHQGGPPRGRFAPNLARGLKNLNGGLKASAVKLQKVFNLANGRKRIANSKLARAAKKTLAGFNGNLKKLGRAGKKLERKIAQKLAKKVGKLSAAQNRLAKKAAERAARAANAAKKLSNKAKHALKKGVKKLERLAAGKHHKKGGPPRGKDGRLLHRYHRPRKNGKLKTIGRLNKSEAKAYAKHAKKAAAAQKDLKNKKIAYKVAQSNAVNAKTKSRQLKHAAKLLAKSAARALKHQHKARANAAKHKGPKSAAGLAASQAKTTKLQVEAVQAKAKAGVAKAKYNALSIKSKAARKALRDAKAKIFDHGFDLLLSKIGSDLAKLDRSLFGKKKHHKKHHKNRHSQTLKKDKEWHQVRRTIEVPARLHSARFVPHPVIVWERIPRHRVRIMAERTIPDSKRPGQTVLKMIRTWRYVKKAPKATGPVTIITKKELRPFKLPTGQWVAVPVKYQVATQTVRDPSSHGKKARFIQQEVQPPFKSGLVMKEKKKLFKVKINGVVQRVPFRVATWSSSQILLKDVKGRQVARVKLTPVESGSAPISIGQVQSAPRMLDGRMMVALLKRQAVHVKRGLVLAGGAVDVPVTKGGRAPRNSFSARRRAIPRTRSPIVYEGVDNSLAQQQARRLALKAVEETIQDNAAHGSISERHLITGREAHAKVDQVRENFYDHQEELVFKKLIKPEHRFID